MPYKTQSPDTSPEVEKMLFHLLRQKTPAERLHLAQEHINGCISRARRRIARQHPDWNQTEVNLHWAEVMYGKELVNRVRDHLRQREELGNG